MTATEEFGARAFGSYNPERAFKSIKRSDYMTEDAYLDAVALEHMRNIDPKFAEARAMVKAAYEQKKNEQQEQDRAARLEEITKATKLESYETANIDKRAREAAERDLAAGKIVASNLGAAIRDYSKKFTDEAINSKSAGSLMNEIFRGKV